MSLPNWRQRFEAKSRSYRRSARKRRSSIRGFQTLESRIALSVTPTGETLSFTEGASASPVVATFTTNDEAPPVNAFTALISWGDGVTDAGTISPTADGFAVSGTHTYADETAPGSPLPVDVTIVDTIDDTTATAHSAANVAEGDSGTLVPQTITPTEGVVFSGSVATFTDNNTLQTADDFSAMIDWGDDTTTAGTVTGGAGTFTISGDHTYSDEGTFTVLASFADDPPSVLSATIVSTAVVAEGDSGTLIPQTITPTEGTAFSGSVATFTDNFIGQTPGDFSATIDWGDGTTTAGTVSGGAGTFTISGDHTYSDEGTFTVLASFADDPPSFLSATIVSTAVVADADGLEGTGATLASTEGQTFSGVVAIFSDSYAGAPAGDFTASIDWGDGAVTAGTITGGNGTFTVSGSHAYLEEGAYQVDTTLEEDTPDTASADAIGIANIANAPLNVTALTFQASESVAFSGTVAAFVDTGGTEPFGDDLDEEGGDEPPAEYAATIDWGDGATTAGTVVDSAGNLSVLGSHTYAEEGPKHVIVTVIDDPGGPLAITGTGSATIVVADLPVNAIGGFTVSAVEHQSSGSQTVATFTDPAGAETLGDYSASIDWGDGATTPGAISLTGQSFTVAGSHTYSKDGSYPITVVVSHDTAPSVMVDSVANVSEPPIVVTSNPSVNGFERSATNAVLATFTHDGGADPASEFQAVVSWGDGTTSAGQVVQSPGGTYTVVGSHVYLDEGAFAVGVTITDGGATAIANGSARVLEELLPDGSRGTPNQRFLTETYRDLFDRQVDSTALPFWGPQLDAGRSRQDVAHDIITLALPHEFGKDEVQAAFQLYLHRNADPLAVEFLSLFLSHGGTLEQMDAFIASSPEYFQTRGGGTNDGFLDALFHDALHRGVDPAARATFDAYFALGGTRLQAIDFIFASTEYKQDLVESYYERFLDRPADLGGLNQFAAQLKAGASDFDVMAELIGSDEYFAKIAS